MKTKILQLLRNSAEYVSGQELCQILRVSRTMVWKIMGQLKAEGYVIEAIQNKGYKIISYPDLITASEIMSRLDSDSFIQMVYDYREIDSTNIQARKLAEENALEGTLVVAEGQQRGRGRRGREWLTIPGTAIAMSLILRPQVMPAEASMLTLVMGLSVAQACIQLYGQEFGIKWPNDLVYNGKKICGILTEMSAQIDYVNYLVIGVGINANMENFPADLKKTATSLQKALGHPISRSQLIVSVNDHFAKNYQVFLANHDLSVLLDEYNDLLVSRDKEVRVLTPGNEYTGRSEGININGELVVKTANGCTHLVSSGEVSVRGIYGYV